ncbi:hypothetical protein HanIR_Chr06g0281341 [Helianthus annuus]|nr:hypothetical protein HanIR_Chr06g0281341 [Helianthus annuus]
MRGSKSLDPRHPIPLGIEDGPTKFDPGPLQDLYTEQWQDSYQTVPLTPDQVANIPPYRPRRYEW